MGVAHSGLANRYFSVRYTHLFSGRTDIPNSAFRIGSFLKAIKKSTRRRKIPFSIDLSTWLRHSWFANSDFAESHLCIRAAITIGIFLRMRIFEIQTLRQPGASFPGRYNAAFAYFLH